MIRIAIALWFLLTLASPASRAQPVHPPTPAPRSGAHDVNPAVSEDGKTLAWFHRDGWNTEIVVARAPFRRVLRRIKLSIHPHATLAPVLSGDGRHLFWASGGAVQRSSLDEKGPAAPETLALRAGPFGLCASRDGTRLAMLVDGPSTRTRSPGWRAVATARRERGGWRQGALLTPQLEGATASSLTMNAAGDRLVFLRGETVVEAQLGENGRAELRPVPGIGGETLALQLSSDGRRLLIQGRPGARQKLARSPISVLARSDRGWGAPTVVVEDQGAEIFSPGLSADGRRIAWVHYRRGADGDPTRSSLRAVSFTAGAWTAPVLLLERKGSFQSLGVAIGNDGSLVCSLSDPDGSRVHRIGSLSARADAVDLSARHRAPAR